MKRILTFGLMVPFFISCSTSTKPDEPKTSTAIFSLEIPSDLQGLIVQIEAIVSAADIDTITQNITIHGDTLATGTIDDIPVGIDRLFTLNAYKSGNIKSHTGSTIVDVLTDSINISITLLPIVSTATITGVFGQGYALEFDGTDDYAIVSNYSFHNEFTIEAWFKILSTQYDRGIIGDYAVPNGALIGLGGPDSLGAISYKIAQKNIGYSYGTPTPQIGYWYHVAGTFDGLEMKLYVDGVLQGTISQTDLPVSPTGDLQFGNYNLNPSHTFHGVIDEVRIWNHARSQAEIQSAMYVQLQGTEAGLDNYWRLDKGNGQIIYNSADGANGRLGSTSTQDGNDPVWIFSDRPKYP